MSKGNNFHESVEKIGGLGTKFQVLFNSATCSSYSIGNYARIPMFHFLEKVNKGESKMVYKCQQLKVAKSHYIAIIIKSD